MNKKWILFGILSMIIYLFLFKKEKLIETGFDIYDWYQEKKIIPEEGIENIPEKIIENITERITGMYKTIYDSIYQYWANLRNIDWLLLKAMATVESSETPDAIGDDNRSFGLMQVSLIVGNSFGLSKEDLLDPRLNVQAGSGFLKQMIDKFGLEGGIQAYNLGETKYRRGLTSPTYLKNVLKHYEALKTIYA